MNKINSLTSLRFIAASMIVIHHSRRLLWWSPEILNDIQLDQGVSFFFILSGFILVYAYPKLNGTPSVIRFYMARFARIWPLHFLAFLTFFALLLPYSHFNNPSAIVFAVLNIFLIQGWIPIKNIFFSYNALSWAISTEAFFYLIFPFLLINFKKNWREKTFGSLLIVIILIWLCNYKLNPSASPIPADGVSTAGILYINPLSRSFEFILGMSTALLWAKYGNDINISFFLASLIEICVFCLAIISVFYAKSLSSILKDLIGFGGYVYLCHTSSSLPFAALIWVMAMQKGILSKVFQFRGLVILGEASYAIFLFHQIFLRFYAKHTHLFPFTPTYFYILFWIFLLIFSLSVMFWIEQPCRRLIMNFYEKRQNRKLNDVVYKNI